ncbi:hypothetical protein EGW08_006645 [Elysia chlorotica]|uniref:Sulfotransferase domain-containing protein n=1 Tax=Elysia chlorotica TaxID=188477 RepID=A0A433TVJ9_ELYCH|nr:hypothetical protein EGW08_006645 [Elysia chlorotica]
MATVKATSVLRGANAVKVLLGIILGVLVFGLFMNLFIQELTRAIAASKEQVSSTKERSLKVQSELIARKDRESSGSPDEEEPRSSKDKVEEMESDDEDEDENKAPNSNLRRQLPKCLIVGFTNCWTMTLAGLLSLNPRIVTAEREMRYFTLNFQKGSEWYRSMMPLSEPNQITVERTPNYITSNSALDRIHEFNSSMKIIALVRDPIMRLMSTYSLHTRRKPDKPIFEHWCGVHVKTRNVLRYIDYASALQNAMARFTRKNVLVLSKEDLEVKPHTVLRSMEEFLGLEPTFSKDDFVYNKEEGATCFKTSLARFPEIKEALVPELDNRTGCLGSSDTRRSHPNIDPEFLEKLLALVKIHNGRLFNLINKKFDWTRPDDL